MEERIRANGEEGRKYRYGEGRNRMEGRGGGKREEKYVKKGGEKGEKNIWRKKYQNEVYGTK